ncbi:MAG: hypothetical protein ACRDA8_16580, partial [Shewanella sp.]
MRLWLLGLMWVSGIVPLGAALAAPPSYFMLQQRDYLSPHSVMQQIERQFSGVIAEFDMDMQEGVLVYQFELINPLANAITRFEYRATDGKLLKQKAAKVTANDRGELEAARLISAKHQTFSGLIALATLHHEGFLTDAKLDHDLGIGYLELKLLNDTGQYKLAFDID